MHNKVPWRDLNWRDTSIACLMSKDRVRAVSGPHDVIGRRSSEDCTLVLRR